MLTLPFPQSLLKGRVRTSRELLGCDGPGGSLSRPALLQGLASLPIAGTLSAGSFVPGDRGKAGPPANSVQTVGRLMY